MKGLNVIAGCLCLSALMFTGCQSSEKNNNLENNSLLKESTLPYGAPDFSQIKSEDFLPAMEYGIEEKLAEIKAIAENTEAPTFENVFVALEKSGQTLSKVGGVFNMLSGANTNDIIQKDEEILAPKLSALSDAIFLNDQLFEKVKTIHSQLDSLDLDAESKKLVEVYYNDFVLSGAELSADDKVKLSALNSETAQLSTKFTTMMIDASKDAALVVDTKEELDGLSEGEIAAAADAATQKGFEGKYLIPILNTTQQPALQSLKNRETRKKLFDKSYNRAELGDKNDSRAIVLRLREIRAEKAKLLGYENYSQWALQDQMAKTPEAIFEFLDKLVPAAVANGKSEAAELQKLIDKEKGGFKLEAYDWNFYSEKLRKEKYDLNEEEIKPYFELFTVLEKGVFYSAEQLYGISFKRRTDFPVYNDDVRVYELFNEDGSSIGLFYCDYFQRDNKSGGAWMSNIIDQSKLLNTKPVIYNICNYAKPSNGEPALISYDDVTTLFHEFGHALHGFFANQTYPTLSGTNVSRDFVEFPSQFNEHWALYPAVLKNYAIHYKTGEPMPEALIAKLKKASTFNQGYAFTEYLEATMLDLQWHITTTEDNITDVNTFETEALKKTGLYVPQIPPRYRTSYFKHVWGGGYASGYYAYLWSEMLDNDAFVWFLENGGLTRENGQRYRDMVLSKGQTEDFNEVYVNFAGRKPSIEPLLKKRGLE